MTASDLRTLAGTLLLGVLGGGLFTVFNIPAGWVAGSMALVGGVALAGARVLVPHRLRFVAYTLVGASMGSGVTTDTLHQMRHWPLSVALVLISTLMCMVVCSWALEAIWGWDRMTARYASSPGGLAPIMAMIAETPSDAVRVATVQTTRLGIVVFTMPWLTAFFAPLPPLAPSILLSNTAPTVMSSPAVMAISLGLCGGVGYLYQRLKLPGGILLGAMIASAILHGAGVANGRLPAFVSVPAFIVTGAIVGSRFQGIGIATLFQMLGPAVGCSLLGVGLTALCAAAGKIWLHFPFDLLWVAYAPGGIEAMMIMGFSMGMDTAFIGTHHLIRILGIGLALPVWARRSQ